MYVYALAVLRLSGKRTFDSLSPVDFLIANAAGDTFDDIFWGEVPFAKGLVAFTVLILWQAIVTYGVWRSERIAHLVNGRATVVVQDGRHVVDNLLAERVGPEDVDSDLRQVQVGDISEVKTAWLEPSGRLSVLRRPGARVAQRRDWARLVKRQA
jgi:uncharacterized membrane protein YcaP (DUF421 family)